MNVAYDQINSSDAAKRIGVSIACIQRWCRDGIINYINVGDGTDKARYLLEEEEVAYLQDLVKKFGIRKAMLWYRKDKNTRQPAPRKIPVKIPVPEVDISEASIVNTDDRLQQVMPKVEAPNYIHEVHEVTEAEHKRNQVFRTIEYIQDIKERLEDIEAERQQLLSELKECQEEVMSYIGV